MSKVTFVPEKSEVKKVVIEPAKVILELNTMQASLIKKMLGRITNDYKHSGLEISQLYGQLDDDSLMDVYGSFPVISLELVKFKEIV